MNLTPLRQQVETLNRQLSQQNIQIKDLISFLSRLTPKSNNKAFNKSQIFTIKGQNELKNQLKNQKPTLNRIKSSVYLSLNNGVKKVLKRQVKSVHDHQDKHRQNQRQIIENNKQTKRILHVKSKNYQEKYCRNLDFQKHIKMTNSINYNKNKENKKYLQLSRPQRKLNSSCSFCRTSITGKSMFTDREINQNNNYSKLNNRQNQECNNHRNYQRKKSMMRLLCTKSKEKKSSLSKRKYLTSIQKNQKSGNCQKKIQSDRKSYQTHQQQSFSKHQMKNFIVKKSLKNCQNNRIKLLDVKMIKK